MYASKTDALYILYKNMYVLTFFFYSLFLVVKLRIKSSGAVTIHVYIIQSVLMNFFSVQKGERRGTVHSYGKLYLINISCNHLFFFPEKQSRRCIVTTKMPRNSRLICERTFEGSLYNLSHNRKREQVYAQRIEVNAGNRFFFLENIILDGHSSIKVSELGAEAKKYFLELILTRLMDEVSFPPPRLSTGLVTQESSLQGQCRVLLIKIN